MNRIIKELATRAGMDYDSRDRYGLFDEEKFAQLIVKECVALVMIRGGTSGTEIFERAEEISNAMEWHFGLKK